MDKRSLGRHARGGVTCVALAFDMIEGERRAFLRADDGIVQLAVRIDTRGQLCVGRVPAVRCAGNVVPTGRSIECSPN